MTKLLLGIAAPASATVTHNNPTALVGFSLSEPDSVADETFTAVLTVQEGALTATGPGVSGSGSDALTVTGSLA